MNEIAKLRETLDELAATPPGATPPKPLGGLGPGPSARPAALPGDALSRLTTRPVIVARPGMLDRPVARAVDRPGQVYRGLPRFIRIATWIAVAVLVGVVIGATAPTALRRVGAVLALQPGLLSWYSARALGFLAYGTIAVSVLYGLLLSTKILDSIAHRPVSFALHKELAIVGLVLVGLHAGVLLADQSFDFSPRAILVPFASPYATVWVGIGQLTFYLTAVITASFYLRRHIGQRAWRLIHYLTFLSFIGASVHGIMSGSDSGSPWAFWIYLVPTVLAVFLLTYRIVVSVAGHLRGNSASAMFGPGPLDRPGAGRAA